MLLVMLAILRVMTVVLSSSDCPTHNTNVPKPDGIALSTGLCEGFVVVVLCVMLMKSIDNLWCSLLRLRSIFANACAFASRLVQFHALLLHVTPMRRDRAFANN